jgi:peptidoglycan/xylan/chitin deacetylase (PgdA/CDA1 family)
MQQQFTLNFHGLGQPTRPLEPGEENFWLPVEWFERILDLIIEVNARGRVRVDVTFDDGNASDVETALPRLLCRGLNGRFFVSSGRLDTPHFLSRPQVRELRRAGMTIGAHGVAHLDWRLLPDDVLEQELRGAKETLADILNEPIEQVAIPYGSYDRRVLRLIKRAGYASAYTSDGGIYRPGGWLKPRTCLRRDRAISEIAQMLMGAGFVEALVQELRLLKRQLLGPRPVALADPASRGTARAQQVKEMRQCEGCSRPTSHVAALDEPQSRADFRPIDIPAE